MRYLTIVDPFYGLEEIAKEHDLVLMDSCACKFNFIPGRYSREMKKYQKKWGESIFLRDYGYLCSLRYLISKTKNIKTTLGVHEELRRSVEGLRFQNRYKKKSGLLFLQFFSHLIDLNPDEERKRKALKSMYRNLIAELGLSPVDSDLVATSFVLTEKGRVALVSNDKGVLKFYWRLKQRYFDGNSHEERTMQFEAFTLIGDKKILPQYTSADNMAYLS